MKALFALVPLGCVSLLAQFFPFPGPGRNATAVLGGKTARQFNGTSDYGVSSANLSFTSSSVITLSFWMYWNAFANTDSLLGEYSTNFNANGPSFLLDPNAAGGNFEFDIDCGTGGFVYLVSSIARPTAAAWHHYVLTMPAAGTPASAAAYVDGSAVTVTSGSGSGCTASTFSAAYPLYLASRAGSSLFGGMRLSEFAVYNGTLTTANISALHSFTKATAVNSGNLLYYWGNDLATATTGSVNFSFTGTSSVTGPNP